MTVLFVQFPPDLYGAGRSLLRLAPLLKADGHKVHVVLPGKGPLSDALVSAGIDISIQPNMGVIERRGLSPRGFVKLLLNTYRGAIQTRNLIRSLQADVVHSNSGIIFTGAFGAFLAGVPHIWHIREWFGEFHLLWKFYSRMILRVSRFVICVSRSIKDQFPPRKHLLIINDGFDATEFDVNHEALGTEFRTRYKLGTELVVGVVGRIKLVRKGQEVLLQAADILERRGIRARYLIVGSPYRGNESHLQELHRLVEELNLSDRVVFTGELADPKSAYASMDIFVLPSGLPEPFGGVVMEAMAMGLPVVATNIGGSVDQVSDGVTGFLVPPSDPARLADRLELLIKDEALRRKLGQAGMERVASEFRLDRLVRKLEEVYAACEIG